MDNQTVVDLASIRTGCKTCSLTALCFSCNETVQGKDTVEKTVISRSHKFDRGRYIFRVNEPFNSVYAIRTGSVKTYTSLENGKEQVTGFHLPGDVLGLDSISTNYHTESAVALESCSICEINFEKLENLSNENPAIQHALLNAMSRKFNMIIVK